MHDLSELDRRVLAALPMELAPRVWVTPRLVAELCGIAPDVARSVLARLRSRGLAIDDGERPQAFARTARGDWLLEHTETG